MISSVAKAGAITTSAVKQIVDVVKSRRAALPKTVEKALSEKSTELLKQLAASPDISSQIAGAGFRTLHLNKKY